MLRPCPRARHPHARDVLAGPQCTAPWLVLRWRHTMARPAAPLLRAPRHALRARAHLRHVASPRVELRPPCQVWRGIRSTWVDTVWRRKGGDGGDEKSRKSAVIIRAARRTTRRARRARRVVTRTAAVVLLPTLLTLLITHGRDPCAIASSVRVTGPARWAGTIMSIFAHVKSRYSTVLYT